MVVPLLVALVTAATLAIFTGVFVAGSLVREKIYWAISIVAIGAVPIIALLALSSNVNLYDTPKILDVNPLRAAEELWVMRDYAPLVKGLSLGGVFPVVALILIPLIWRRRPGLRLPSLTVFFALLIGGLFATAAFAEYNSEVPIQGISQGIQVPERYVARPYLPSGLSKPTAISFDSEDRLYVATLAGNVHIVTDTNQDGLGDQVSLFFRKDGLALGLAISDDDRTIFVSGSGTVDRVDDLDGDRNPDSVQRIVEGLPSVAPPVLGITIGPDGRLYMTVGGTTNVGPELNPLGGKILVSRTDGSDLSVYASGLRNSYDLAFTSTGILVASDNAPDGVDYLPPAELNVIIEGKNHGYPTIFGEPPIESETIGPVAVYPDMSAPTGVVAYQGEEFPSKFDDSIFLSLWGPPGDSKVVVVELEETPTGEYKGVSRDFALGFVSAVDVAIDNRGRLYVADFGANQVYQISKRIYGSN